MTHYSNTPADVRVDFFKPSGKWGYTTTMRWITTEGSTWLKPTALIHDEFKASLRKAFGTGFQGMTAICLEPYHPHAHPLMLLNWSQ